MVKQAADLAVGDTITGVQRLTENLTPYINRLKRGTQVKQVEPCPGQRRTHVHVNGGACWDGRTVLEVT